VGILTKVLTLITVSAFTAIAALAASSAEATDILVPPPPPALKFSKRPSDWQFRFTPYAWLIGVSGSTTAKDRSTDSNATFFDAVQKSDSLIGFMSYFEARNDRWVFYADVIWGSFKFAGSGLRERNPVAGLSLSASADTNLKATLAIVEVGTAYEMARWGTASGTLSTIDAVVGARYWYTSIDLALAITGAVDLAALGLERSGNLAIARTGGMQWVDPVVGVNLRHQFSPGNEVRMRADVGGFGVGSKFSWQLFAGYAHEFKINDTTLAGIIGYRAINVDFSKGSGVATNGVNLLLHGPVLGLGFRW
jgi:hypothetical protein